MGLLQLVLFGLFAVVLEVSQTQCTQSCRMRSYVPTRTIITCPQEQTRSSPSSTEDLNKLILLAKLLVEKNSNKDNNIDGESIIKKLIDALIYTTLQYNQCRATLELFIRGSKEGAKENGNGGGGSGGKGLIVLNLLDPNSPNNVLDLGLAGNDLLGVGLGKGGNGSGSSGGKGGNGGSGGSTGSKGGNGSGADSPIIDLGLLRPNQSDNVLDLSLAGQNLLGVGIEKSPSEVPVALAPSHGGKGGKDGSSNGSSGQSLIDLTLLRPDSQNNVLDLVLSGKDILGVGLGDT